MKRVIFLLVVALVALPGLAQRGATLSPSSQAFAQQAQLLREIQYRLQALDSRLEGIEQQHQSLSNRIGALERGTGVATKDDLAAVRSDLEAVRSAQKQLRGEIVDELSGKLAAISKREASARAAAERRAAEQASGYRHTVESGQTLSAIAEAYKVPVRTIMRANKISDPSKLRVGQKLFIPDP